MRHVRYSVAMSLDGYIAGPNGEADWIINDPEIDFAELFGRFDTILVGRNTYEAMAQYGNTGGPVHKMQTIVFSRTLQQADHPNVTIVSDDGAKVLRDLQSQPGKDIWLFGGGVLFRSLAEAELVDSVEVAVIPVLLGGGISLLPPPAKQSQLALTGHKIYRSGIVLLEYAICKL